MSSTKDTGTTPERLSVVGGTSVDAPVPGAEHPAADAPEGVSHADLGACEAAIAAAERGAGDAAGDTAVGLSDRDHKILEFERQWWKYSGAKEQAVKELFDMSATRYYQVLNALIDTPEALAQDPMLVKRLRRMRSSRQRARTARRLGVEA